MTTLPYKLIVTDLDGTLLDDSKRISNINLQYIRRAREAGVKIAVATGRPYASFALHYRDILSLDTPITVTNGAIICESDTGKILRAFYNDRKDAKHVFALTKERDATLFVWTSDALYASKLGMPDKFYLHLGGMLPKLIDDPDELIERGIAKMIWRADPKLIEKWYAELDPSDFPSSYFLHSEPPYLEFFNPNATKANGVKILCEKYGILPEETIALGDTNLDLSMVEYSGLGVAMSNACDNLLASADVIAPSNNQNGVAWAIAKFIFGEEL